MLTTLKVVENNGRETTIGDMLSCDGVHFIRRCHDPSFVALVDKVAKDRFGVHVQFHKFQLYDAEPFDVHAFGEKCTHVPSKAGKLPALILTPIE